MVTIIDIIQEDYPFLNVLFIHHYAFIGLLCIVLIVLLISLWLKQRRRRVQIQPDRPQNIDRPKPSHATSKENLTIPDNKENEVPPNEELSPSLSVSPPPSPSVLSPPPPQVNHDSVNDPLPLQREEPSCKELINNTVVSTQSQNETNTGESGQPTERSITLNAPYNQSVMNGVGTNVVLEGTNKDNDKNNDIHTSDHTDGVSTTQNQDYSPLCYLTNPKFEVSFLRESSELVTGATLTLPEYSQEHIMCVSTNTTSSDYNSQVTTLSFRSNFSINDND